MEPPHDVDKAPSRRVAVTGRWRCCFPLSLSALATLLAGFLAELGLHQAPVVCHSWGGAQLLIGPGGTDRVVSLVLVSCEAFDYYPPALSGRLPGRTFLVAQLLGPR